MRPRMKRGGNGAEPAELARYIVSVIEGAIMLARARHDRRLIARQFDVLKEHLVSTLGP